MANRPPLAADTRDGIASTIYLWLVVGFLLGLIVELAVLGFNGLMNASLLVVFAVPLAVGAACMGLVWALHRMFGPSAVAIASWSAGGTYVGMFAAGLGLKLAMLWQFTMPILLAGMVAGSIVGLIVGLARVRAGNRNIFMP